MTSKKVIQINYIISSTILILYSTTHFIEVKSIEAKANREFFRIQREHAEGMVDIPQDESSSDDRGTENNKYHDYEEYREHIYATRAKARSRNYAHERFNEYVKQRTLKRDVGPNQYYANQSPHPQDFNSPPNPPPYSQTFNSQPHQSPYPQGAHSPPYQSPYPQAVNSPPNQSPYPQAINSPPNQPQHPQAVISPPNQSPNPQAVNLPPNQSPNPQAVNLPPHQSPNPQAVNLPPHQSPNPQVVNLPPNQQSHNLPPNKPPYPQNTYNAPYERYTTPNPYPQNNQITPGYNPNPVPGTIDNTNVQYPSNPQYNPNQYYKQNTYSNYNQNPNFNSNNQARNPFSYPYFNRFNRGNQYYNNQNFGFNNAQGNANPAPFYGRGRFNSYRYPNSVIDSPVYGGATPLAPTDHFGALDIRVGKILTATQHPETDTLIVLSVDVGDATPKSAIISLEDYLTIFNATNTTISDKIAIKNYDDIVDRLFIFWTNMQEKYVRGVLTDTLMLVARYNDMHEFLIPPDSCIPGDFVQAINYPRSPKLKISIRDPQYKNIKREFHTNIKNVAMYRRSPWVIFGKGEVRSPSLSFARIG